MSPHRAGPSRHSALASLPAELIEWIFDFLSTSDLKSVALVSKHLRGHAIGPLWQHVCLTDTWKLHLNDETRIYWGDRGNGECDEHDDTPLIWKLYVLAVNPAIASKVQVVTHRCHLPPPGIFSELPHAHFDSPDLSRSPYIPDLIRLAVRNLVNVHTLRVICGHRNITTSLLEAFLDPTRPRHVPLRRLWLESSSILGARIDFGAELCALESIRIRRLRAEVGPRQLGDDAHMRFPEFRISRWGRPLQLHDGAGGFYHTPVQFARTSMLERRRLISPEETSLKAEEFDAGIWKGFPHLVDLIERDRANPLWAPPVSQAPSLPLLQLLQSSSSTITRLNLDWILWRPVESRDDEPARAILVALSQMTFPNLCAFQLRNAVVRMTELPSDIYLLETTFLDFLERHPKIRCLAFPLDRFYSHEKPSQDILNRSRKLVAHLGMVLNDLRLDSLYKNNGDPITDDGTGGVHAAQRRISRRRFIKEFAPFMTKVEHIKLEGGIPRDEKREILRALHLCSLKRIVMIGASFPVGNTWGPQGEDLKKVDDGIGDSTYDLEEEDKAAISSTFAIVPLVRTPFEFDPSYGWPPSTPFLNTIAAHHANTVEELKLCGFNGCPVLTTPLPITKPLLWPLRHFWNLRQLIISLWLVTYFEHDYRDAEIIQSWKDVRSPASTALVVIPPPMTPSQTSSIVTPTMAPGGPNPAARPQSYNRWAVALKTRFSPSALAYRVAADIGPYLSPIAKARKGGVRVRASFCLGAKEEHRSANDIFDLDIRIGRDDQVLEFVGPREEGEKGRWWDKMEGRRWF